MILRQLINKSIYGTIGYISSIDDINLFESYTQYNLPILKEFKEIIIAINYNNDPELVKLFKNRIENLIECQILTLDKNRGHNFGTADLDNMLFNYCKENNIEWLCKSANDVILDESLLNKQIGDADFYYLNGIGIGGMVKYNFDDERIINEDFYPQTNFYLINISKTDYLNNSDYINQTYDYIQTLSNYNGRVWEYISGWSCEDFLKQCIERNNLKKEHLIGRNNYLSLLNLVKLNNIHDSSYKNIMIEGVCHFHYPEQKIYKI